MEANAITKVSLTITIIIFFLCVVCVMECVGIVSLKVIDAGNLIDVDSMDLIDL